MAEFWTGADTAPKRNYRFKVFLGVASTTGIIWYAKTFSPPSYEVSETTHDYLDNKFYWPGRVTWADCKLQLVDPVTPNAVQMTNQMLIASGYKVPTKKGDTMSTINKKGGVGHVISVIVSIVDADGDVIEEWTLKNPWLKAAAWSDLDYTNDELRTIDMTFRYDWATCVNRVLPNASEQFTSVAT